MFKKPVYQNDQYQQILALQPEQLVKRAKRNGWFITMFTWVVYWVIRIFKKPEVYKGVCDCFKIGKSWGGVQLGFFFIVGSNSMGSAQHEVGHLIQTAKINCFKMALLSLGSAARYWKRRITKDYSETYDAWWFQGQATYLGKQYIKRHGK